MVKSEETIINNIGKKNIYYCSICKTAFLNFKNATSDRLLARRPGLEPGSRSDSGKLGIRIHG